MNDSIHEAVVHLSIVDDHESCDVLGAIVRTLNLSGTTTVAELINRVIII